MREDNRNDSSSVFREGAAGWLLTFVEPEGHGHHGLPAGAPGDDALASEVAVGLQHVQRWEVRKLPELDWWREEDQHMNEEVKAVEGRVGGPPRYVMIYTVTAC